MKRHEVLGKNLHASLQYTLQSVADHEVDYQEETALGQPAQQFVREGRIGIALWPALLEHLGYGPIPDVRRHLDSGVDYALDYFFGDWWRYSDDHDARALDKSRPDRELRWFGVFPEALLLGGLTGRWDDVSRICSWFDGSIETEYQAGLIEDQYMQLFIAIAGTLRPVPMPDLPQRLAHVKESRTKRPRLLCDAWEAAIAKDQKAFDKAMKQSVAHFIKHDARDVPNITYWLALHQSFVWLVAERNGLAFPTLAEQLDAAVVRRQTIGLT